MNVTTILTKGMSIALLMILLMSQGASAVTPNNLDIGDTFTFTGSAGGNQEINGTEYFDTSDIIDNQVVEVEVTDIQEGTGNFLTGSDTYVNYTETVGDDVFQGSSYIDDYQVFAIFILFIAFADINTLDFSEPDEEDIEDDEELVSSFPYFANSNESYYREVDDEEGGTQTFDDGDGNRIHVDIGYDDPNEIFTYNYEITASEEGTTDIGEDYTLSIGFLLEATVDVSRSILTHFRFELFIEATVGDDASIDSNLFIEMNEGDGSDEGGIFGLDFSPLTILFASFAAIAIVVKKRRY